MGFDYRPVAAHLDSTQAKPQCLLCGSNDVKFADTRYALIELDEKDQLAVETDWGLASSLKCLPRICDTCGFVHLHALVVIERAQSV